MIGIGSARIAFSYYFEAAVVDVTLCFLTRSLSRVCSLGEQRDVNGIVIDEGTTRVAPYIVFFWSVFALFSLLLGLFLNLGMLRNTLFMTVVCGGDIELLRLHVVTSWQLPPLSRARVWIIAGPGCTGACQLFSPSLSPLGSCPLLLTMTDEATTWRNLHQATSASGIEPSTHELECLELSKAGPATAR